jgi:hypothetical protein
MRKPLNWIALIGNLLVLAFLAWAVYVNPPIMPMTYVAVLMCLASALANGWVLWATR